ncbi:hypothetical protein HDU77_011323 [Chytriomyces hyalinus]|nr:hypothetical protein HDU77_011323 [Chytriomyces hyalinus]
MDQPHSTTSTSLSLDLLVAAATMAPNADTSFNFRQPSLKLSTHPMSINYLVFDHQDISDIPGDPSMSLPQYEHPSIPPPPQYEQPAAPAWPTSALKDNKLPFTLISPPITPMFTNTSITKSQVQPHSFPTTRSDSASPTNTCFKDTCSKEKPLCSSMLQSPNAAAGDHEMQSRPHRRCAPSFQETTPPATSARKQQLPTQDAVKRGAAKYSHEVTHSTNYNFVCTLPGCASKFRRNQDLLRHWRNVKH